MARVPAAGIGTAGVDVRPIAPSYQQTSGLLVDAIQSRNASQNIENAAQKVEGVSNVLANEAIKAQMEDNDRAAKKADVAFSEQTRAVMFGDGTPENPGYYGLKGEAALAAYPKVREQLTEARKKIGGTLTNAKAREMFELSAAGRLDSEGRSMDRHNTQERVTANNAAGLARINSAISNAINYRSNSDMVGEQEAVVRGEVHSEAGRNGYKPETTAARLKEELSKMYYGMVKAELTANPMNAQKIYDKYKTVMDGPTRTVIEKELEGGVMLQQVQEESDRIVKMRGSPEQLIAEAEKIKDPKVRDGVVKAVQHKIAWQQTRDTYALAQGEKAAMQAASRAVTNGMPVDQFMRENPQYAGIVAGKLGAVDSLYRIERLRAEGARFSNATTGALQKLRATPAGELAEHDLEGNRYSYTRNEYEEASKLVEGAKQRVAEWTQPGSKVMNEGQQVLNSFMPRDAKGKVEQIAPQEREIASNEMSGWVASYVKTNGKPPSLQDMEKEAARIMLRVKIGDGYFGDVASGTTIAGRIKFMTPEEKATVRVPFKSIPAGTLEDARAAFKRAGKTPSKNDLEEYVGALLADDKARGRKLLGE